MSTSFLGISVAAIAALSAIPAQASPYINFERNEVYEGSSSLGSVNELHVGYKSSLGEKANWYGQLGPAFLAPENGDSSTQVSGKVGLGADLTDELNAYGEFSFVTAEGDADNGYATKLGLTYSF
tara:strand:- start:17 stop:391 length:375 start_codon:yes stop_codon:yes gene_type:complete